MTKLELESYFSKRLKKRVSIVFTNNRVRMASYKKGLRTISLRLHEQFIHSDEEQLNELVTWMKNPKKKPSFIKEFVMQIPNRSTAARIYNRTVGKNFDLTIHLKKVIEQYFPEFPFDDLTISWGRKSPQKRVRSRKLGSFRHDTRQILIHPILDDKRVPEYVLEFMIYHELLHSLQSRDIKRPHNKDFRDKEKKFKRFSEVMDWQEISNWIMN